MTSSLFAQAAFVGAQHWATTLANTSSVGTAHLLFAMTRIPNCRAAVILQQVGVSLEKLQSDLRLLMPRPTAKHDVAIAESLKSAMRRAHEEAADSNATAVDTAHMLIGLILEPFSLAGQILANNFGLTPSRVRLKLEDLSPEK